MTPNAFEKLRGATLYSKLEPFARKKSGQRVDDNDQSAACPESCGSCKGGGSDPERVLMKEMSAGSNWSPRRLDESYITATLYRKKPATRTCPGPRAMDQ